MKNIYVTMILLLSLNLFAENINKPIITDNSYSKVVIFGAFHDPGWIVTNDDKEYYFGYEGITFENISEWQNGRKLIYSYDINYGLTLFDEKSNARATIRSYGTHPIDLILEDCLEKNQTTMGMAGCYDQGYTNWDAEMNRRYKELKKTYSPENFKIIQAMQRKWLKYRDSRFNVNRMAHNNETGTITIIESSSRAYAIVATQAGYLLSIPNGANK